LKYKEQYTQPPHYTIMLHTVYKEQVIITYITAGNAFPPNYTGCITL